MVIKITHKNPIEAKYFIEALASEPKLKIIKLLVDGKSLTATEISNKLNISLSTIIDHLNQLVKANILTTSLIKRRGKLIKTYKLRDYIWSVKIDLRTYVNLLDIEEIENLAREYIERKIQEKGLPIKFNIKELMNYLNLNLDKAYIVLNYLKNEDNVISILEEIFNKKFSESEIPINKLAEKMNIHVYWAYRLAYKLSEDQRYVVKNGKLIKLK